MKDFKVFAVVTTFALTFSVQSAHAYFELVAKAFSSIPISTGAIMNGLAPSAVFMAGRGSTLVRYNECSVKFLHPAIGAALNEYNKAKASCGANQACIANAKLKYDARVNVGQQLFFKCYAAI